MTTNHRNESGFCPRTNRNTRYASDPSDVRTPRTRIHYSYSYGDKPVGSIDFPKNVLIRNIETMNMKPNLLPPGSAPGFAKLKSQPGVFRCKLWPVTQKKKTDHADYAGVLTLSAGARAQVLLWTHSDGSLGLRLELIKNTSPAAQCAKLSPKP